MKLLLLLIGLLLTYCSWSQFNLEWTKRFDVSVFSDRNFQVDQSGNCYVLSKNIPNEGDQLDQFTADDLKRDELVTLSKVDASGKIVWHLTMNSILGISKDYAIRSEVHFRDIAVSEDGQSIAIMGYFDTKNEIPPGVNPEHPRIIFSNGEGTMSKYFIICLSGNGKEKWKNIFDAVPIYNHQLEKIKFGPKHELYLTKAYKEEVQFKRKKFSTVTKGEERIGIFRFTENGKLSEQLISWKQSSLLNKDMESHHYINGIEMQFDKEGNIYLYGDYSCHLVLSEDVQLSSVVRYKDTRAGFLAKYSPDMKLEWYYKLAGRTGGGKISNLDFNDSGELYFAGNFTTAISVFNNGEIQLETDSPTINHSGSGMFYGKISSAGKLMFTKYHIQDKHYTDCSVSNFWLDDYGRAHILGVYEDSLQIQGSSNSLFSGMRIDTSVTHYNGMELPTVYVRYFEDIYHAVYKEDSIYSLEKVFKFNKVSGGINFFGYPTVVKNTLYFVHSSRMDIDVELAANPDQKYKHEGTKESGIVKLSLSVIRSDTIEFDESDTTCVLASETKGPIKGLEAMLPDVNNEKELDIDTTHIKPFQTEVMTSTLNVFPNPFVNHITVNLKNPPSKIQLALYNDLGQILVSQMHTTGEEAYEFALSLSGLSNGAYFLEIQGDNYRKIVKLIKSE